MTNRNSFVDRNGRIFHRMKDLTGNIYGNLEVISFYAMNEHHQSLWVCRCSCGKETICNSNTLKDGDKKSCGCIKRGRNTQSRRLPKNIAKLNALYSVYRAGAKNRNLSFSLSKNEFLGLVSLDCFYCGKSPEKDKYNGIDRLDSDKGYELSNCVPACKICNYAKNTVSYLDFRNWISRIADHMLSKEILYATSRSD